MNWRKIAHFTSLSLFAVFLALYVASKIHFFSHYDLHHTGQYLREHSRLLDTYGSDGLIHLGC